MIMVVENGKIRKILSIHWGFIPGGVAVYARHIERVGSYAPLYLKTVCITAPDWPFDQANADNMDMDVIKINGRADFSWVAKVRKIMKEESPELVLTHGFNGAFVGVLGGCGLKIPKVSSWHGDYFPSNFRQRIRKPFFDLLLKILFRHYVGDVVTVSHFSEESLVHKGVDRGKIVVVHNGIPPEPVPVEYRTIIRDELHISDDCILAGTACRLAAQKGLEWFLRAVAIVVLGERNIHFVIWGDGPQREYLKGLIDELGIGEYVSLPGYRSDVFHCLPALDIFVMSSYAEYFSIALLEAMRAGLPIVATDVGGNPEAIKREEEGILVPPADPKALAESILILVNDPARRERMAQLAQQRFLAEFTSERMVEQTASWLMACVRKHDKEV